MGVGGRDGGRTLLAADGRKASNGCWTIRGPLCEKRTEGEREWWSMMGYDMRGCDMRGCDIRGCDMRGCDMRGCDIRV